MYGANIPGLPDFYLLNIPKRVETNQSATKLRIGHKIYVPNGRNIFQTAIEHTYLSHSKALQIWIFGLKTYHLATLQYRTNEVIWKSADPKVF
jgi:hypothetical protein